MEKRGLLLLVLIFSIGFVSAQANIGDILEAFGEENLLLFGIFIISFVLINFALGRLSAFKQEKNKAVPAVIAIILALFITYGINRLNISNFFFNIGISIGSLETIGILISIGGLIFLFWKFKKWGVFILGLLLIIISIFTDWVYEKDTVLIIGLGLILLWIIIRAATKKERTRE